MEKKKDEPLVRSGRYSLMEDEDWRTRGGAIWNHNVDRTTTRVKCRATTCQLVQLVKFMEKHPQLAVSHSRPFPGSDELWMQLADHINQFGPPKNYRQCKTTWRDLRKRAFSMQRGRNKKSNGRNLYGMAPKIISLVKAAGGAIPKGVTVEDDEGSASSSKPNSPPPEQPQSSSTAEKTEVKVERTAGPSGMPRNYKRKTETKYSVEDLKKAIEDVKSGKLSIGKASTLYSVPKTTLADNIKKEIIKIPRCGRKSVFSDHQESELENLILNCSKLFNGLTIRTVRKLAYKFAEDNKIPHSFNTVKKMAGIDWYKTFIKRHPRVSSRKPEISSLSCPNAAEVQLFYNNLITLQKKYKFGPDRIFNVDETGFANVFNNENIFKSDPSGCTLTVVCAFSASGQYVPPFFIFKRKRMIGRLLKGANDNMIAAVTAKGRMNDSLFVQWLHHFKSYAKPTEADPVLLVLDDHDSHISIDACTLCTKNGIILLTLPPHASSMLQPLDLSFYGPLKTAYNQECEYYMAEHPGKSISQYDFVSLFTKAFNQCSILKNAASGFKAAGICPLQPVILPEDESTQNTDAQGMKSQQNAEVSPQTPAISALDARNSPVKDLVCVTELQAARDPKDQRYVRAFAPNSPVLQTSAAPPDVATSAPGVKSLKKAVDQLVIRVTDKLDSKTNVFNRFTINGGHFENNITVKEELDERIIPEEPSEVMEEDEPDVRNDTSEDMYPQAEAILGDTDHIDRIVEEKNSVLRDLNDTMRKFLSEYKTRNALMRERIDLERARLQFDMEVYRNRQVEKRANDAK